MCLISHMSRHLLVQIINPIKSEAKGLYCFMDLILLKFFGFFFNVSSRREENWTRDGRESVKIS